ncbi:unnamed protein product [Clonostachys rosea f. rosea IK726]|jgi:hypothetical protein|uniref:DUF7907 domain-containing protein n=2 Tax=Bionectria ochroleuca TaxID=29856 RepID=A0A0B7K7V6_BIOOC|nr:unnamed protein product [Clonostachys rosea f. rosea IK726]
MFNILLGLTLLGAAASSPLRLREETRSPSFSTSKGFNLIVDLADPSNDFATPIQYSFVTSIHVGAGLALVGFSSDKGRVFYQNGTTSEYEQDQATIITDGGTPTFPSGLKLTPDAEPEGFTTGHLDAGPGTPGVMLSRGAVPELQPVQFYACEESISYYEGKSFVILRHGAEEAAVPSECRKIRLLPQCTTLADLSPDALSSHEYALDSPCYDAVSQIDWST